MPNKTVIVLTIKDISAMLGLSTSTVRTHLECFEKYRVPRSHPISYYYTYWFLLDLRDFYQTKSESIGKKYRYYNKTVKIIDSLLSQIKTSQKRGCAILWSIRENQIK